MLHFGCTESRNLDCYVNLPEDDAVFDSNFEQKAPLEIKDKHFVLELKAFIKMWVNTFGKDIIKKPKGHKQESHNRKIHHIKYHGIVSMLRGHFKDLSFTEF